jgi:hypothetical protein
VTTFPYDVVTTISSIYVKSPHPVYQHGESDHIHLNNMNTTISSAPINGHNTGMYKLPAPAYSRNRCTVALSRRCVWTSALSATLRSASLVVFWFLSVFHTLRLTDSYRVACFSCVMSTKGIKQMHNGNRVCMSTRSHVSFLELLDGFRRNLVRSGTI